MRCGVEPDLDGEFVAAGDARGRMQHDAVADPLALGIEGLLDAQRPKVLTLRQHRTLATPLEAKLQPGLP